MSVFVLQPLAPTYHSVCKCPVPAACRGRPPWGVHRGRFQAAAQMGPRELRCFQTTYGDRVLAPADRSPPALQAQPRRCLQLLVQPFSHRARSPKAVYVPGLS